MANQNDKKTIEFLTSLIVRHRKEGLTKVMTNCNDFGNPALNFLYVEIYACCKNGQSILALAGAGMFLEEFLNHLWISSQTHKAQITNKFNSWDEVMSFIESQYKIIEDINTKYWKDIRPSLKNIIAPDDLGCLELLREFVRNTFIHSKRIRFIKALRDHGYISKQTEARKDTFTDDMKFVNTQQVKISQLHPLSLKIGYKALADQLAPAMLIYIFEMFKKYHKDLAPLRDDKIKFPGHECKYDSN